MAHRNRIHIRNALVYAVVRGHKDVPLLGEQQDRERLESLIVHALTQCRARLIGFCWLPHEWHLVIRLSDVPLESLMRRVCGPYSRYLHRERNWRGRVYQSRYRAVVVDSEVYLLALLQYVHRLPVMAGRCAHPDDYAWSSHRAYRGEERLAWLSRSEILEALGQKDRDAARAYLALMNEPPDARISAQFEHGSWMDSRVAGGLGFVGAVARKSAGRRAPLPASEILSAVARWQNVPPSQLFSRPLSRHAVLVRSLVAWHLLAFGGTNLARIARQFSVRRWTLRSAMQRHCRCHPELFNVPLDEILGAAARTTDSRARALEQSKPSMGSDPPEKSEDYATRPGCLV